ncbi:MAG: Smr/MutS family protein [Pseudomonadota bacterium]
MRKRRSHELTGPERSLWNQVAKTVAPMPGRKTVTTDEMPALPDADLALPAPLSSEGLRKPLATPPKTSPFQAGDPRRARAVARGRLTIDAVLDLHGMRQTEADRATLAFITRCVTRGHRVLLIITGKGSKDSEHGRGVLRKRFLEAVDAGSFGREVASVRPAHQKHGGSGAFYVFLKAPKPAEKRASVTKGSQVLSKR